MIDLILQAAKHALLPDILVSSLGSLICVGLTALSTGNQKLNEKELKMYHDIAKSNWTRLRIRSSAKITIFSLILYLEWTNKIEQYRDQIPTFSEICLLSMFFGSMALLDELYDTVKIVKVQNDNMPQIVYYINYVLILAPIFILITSKMVFVYFTIIIICSQIIAKKLDIVIFVLTAVVGILVVVFTLWEADAFNEIPIMGIATVIFGHILYETYDEFEIFKNMVEKGFPPIVFELCNQHFLMPILAGLGYLPYSFLFVSMQSYPAIKMGLAIGTLGFWKTFEIASKKQKEK